MPTPYRPFGRQRHQLPIRQRYGIGLLPGRGLLPLAKVINWDQVTAPLERVTESWPGLDPLGLGIEVREADVDVLGPERHAAPMNQVQAALGGPGIKANDRQLVSGRGVLTGAKFGFGLCDGVERQT